MATGIWINHVKKLSENTRVLAGIYCLVLHSHTGKVGQLKRSLGPVLFRALPSGWHSSAQSAHSTHSSLLWSYSTPSAEPVMGSSSTPAPCRPPLHSHLLSSLPNPLCNTACLHTRAHICTPMHPRKSPGTSSVSPGLHIILSAIVSLPHVRAQWGRHTFS